MTRKAYYHKGMQLVVAINRDLNGKGIGKQLRHFRDCHRDAPKHFGSYEAAWNSEAFKTVRRIYLKEDC